MKTKKMLLIWFIAMFFVVILLCNNNCYAANTTVDALRRKFPAGKFWNHYAGSDHYYYNGIEDSGKCNNPDGYTDTQCVRHDGGTAGYGQADCNSFDGGQECAGFARKLFFDYYGQYARNMQTHTNKNSIKPGDVVRYEGDGAANGGHEVWVIGVDSNKLIVAECNWYKRCEISWDRWVNKNNITVTNVYSAPYAIDDNKDSEKPKIVDSGIDMSSITASSFKIRVKATDNVGVTSVGFNIWAPNSNSHVWKKATYNSSTGYWEYTVRKSSFGNAAGVYSFDTYVSDAAGNSTNKGFSPFPMGTTVVKTLGDFTARIVSKQNTNYVIGTDGTQNESSAVLKTKSLSDNSQIWKFTKNSDNTYTITHVLSGKVLDVYNYSNENKAKIQIYTKGTGTEASFGTNQKFYIMSYNGGYRIVPKCSNDLKAIDNADAKVASGNKMQLYEGDRTSNAAQTWTFEKVATALSMNTTSTSIRVGESKSLSATITPSNVANRNLTWSSSNRSIVTVSSNGIIKGIKMGTATITAKTTDGSNKTATCRVTVTLPFTDVPLNSWYYSAVEYCYQNGIITGMDSTTFAPNKELTRGMLVLMLYRIEGEPQTTVVNKFTDVPKAQWYYNAVRWAASKGIVHGYDNGKFGPEDNIIRQDLAVILRNYSQYKGKNVNATSNLLTFKDGNTVSGYAKTAMRWAVGKGVITGNADNNTLTPHNTATRAETASMIYKYCTKVK